MVSAIHFTATYISDDSPCSAKRLDCLGTEVLNLQVFLMQTYMDAEIVPGSRLNLVLGPNG